MGKMDDSREREDLLTYIKKVRRGTSLVAQWVRLHTPNAGGPGSIPGQGTRSHLPQLTARSPQLEKALAQERRPNTAKNK